MDDVSISKCLSCGSILQVSTTKPRKFCGDRCKLKYQRIKNSIVSQGNSIVSNDSIVSENSIVQEKNSIVSVEDSNEKSIVSRKVSDKISTDHKSKMEEMARQDNVSVKEFIEKLLDKEYNNRNPDEYMKAIDRFCEECL